MDLSGPRKPAVNEQQMSVAVKEGFRTAEASGARIESGVQKREGRKIESENIRRAKKNRLRKAC